MAYVIILLGFCALAHFIYEGIVAPTLRLQLRYELFGLRDELRSLKIAHQEDFEDETFKHLEIAISNAIVWAHTVSISRMVEVQREFDTNQGLRQRVKYRKDLLERSHISEVKDIANRTTRLVQRSLFVNSGCVWLCFLPIFFILNCAAGINKMRVRLRSIAFMPENDVQRIAHEHYGFKWA